MSAIAQKESQKLIHNIEAILPLRRASGPLFFPDQHRLASAVFGPHLSHLIGFMKTDPGWKQRFTEQQAATLVTQLEVADGYYVQLCQRFLAADDKAATCRRGGSVYSVAAKEFAAQLGETVSRVRVALGFVGSTQDERYLFIAKGCGVGETVRYASPVEVFRFGSQQLLMLENPENQNHLQALGFRADIFVDQLRKDVRALGPALEVGTEQDFAALQAVRDDEQMRMEILIDRILSLVTVALGSEKAAELSAVAPTRKKSKKKAAAPADETGKPADANKEPAKSDGKQPSSPPDGAEGSVSKPAETVGSSNGPNAPPANEPVPALSLTVAKTGGAGAPASNGVGHA